MKRALVGVLAVCAVAALLLVSTWHAQRAERAGVGGPTIAADTTLAGTRSRTMWYVAAAGDSAVPVVQETIADGDLRTRVASLVEPLTLDPPGPAVAVLPPGTTVLQAYLDMDGLLTLDLSRAFVQGFRGGALAEDVTLTCVVRTLADNLPEARRIRFACGGAPLVSLAGHIPLDRSLDPADWR